jgi:precorrin-2 dehydrogenase/sirohydrochlorin ferrochelatase
LSLKLDDRRCVVVGGGGVAARKVASLLECGARVVVISPELCAALEERVAAGEIEVARRPFEPEDVKGAVLAIASTDDTGVNEAVVAAAHRYGALVNVVDVPELCDFYVPASLRRGDLEITVSTSAACPALSKRLRIGLETQFGPEYAPFLRLLARLRRELKMRLPNQKDRAKAEEALLDTPALALLAEGKTEEAEKVLYECLARSTGS